MNKNYFIILVSILISSCSQSIKKQDLSKLNGYWEIQKVVLDDGTKKDYSVNETIDFFEFKDNVGFRKKVTPQLDGTYLVNNQYEKISISEKENDFFINYSTQYTKFKEQIVEIQDSVLVLKNEQNVEYHYKKPIPFSVK